MAWAVLWGPLAGRLVRMDPAWLAVLASKDYLFPNRWPLDAWLVNLAYPAVIVLLYRVRRRAGLAGSRERGLVVGALALVLAFLATLPLVAAGVALAVQLQIPRMFWFLDFLATVYVVWALTEHPGWRLGRWRAVTVAVLAAASLGRGVYVTVVDGGRRPGGAAVARLGPAPSDWEQVMRWLQTTPVGSNVLADPGHAWRYGTSVRAAALRDVYLEEVKDSAIAIYSRAIAMRVTDRIRALGDFNGAHGCARARAGRAVRSRLPRHRARRRSAGRLPRRAFQSVQPARYVVPGFSPADAGWCAWAGLKAWSGWPEGQRYVPSAVAHGFSRALRPPR